MGGRWGQKGREKRAPLGIIAPMNNIPPPQNPYDALGAETWQKGLWLGLRVMLFFVLGAVLAFLLTSITGWSSAMRLFVALFIGPIFGTVFFFIAWRMAWREA